MLSSWPLLGIVALFASRATADCECGYSVNATSADKHVVFTDLLETNFLLLQNITNHPDWRVQNYTSAYDPSVSPHAFGMKAELQNVVTNPLKNNDSLQDGGVNGGDPGLQLYVRGGTPADNLIGIGEVDAARSDMIWGSFRTSLKMTSVNGSCGAVFYYFNETQEIDFEFLSYQEDNHTSGRVNLVLHPTADEPFQSTGSERFDTFELPFRPDDGFHEYRFDWLPGLVSFYADGVWLKDLTDGVPDHPGGLYLKHWSNGQKTWSLGPPEEDSILTIEYVKAYFNSSNTTRQADATKVCTDPSQATAICQIPDFQNQSTNVSDFSFFSIQPNKTAGQEKKTSAGTLALVSPLSTGLFGTVLFAALVVAL